MPYLEQGMSNLVKPNLVDLHEKFDNTLLATSLRGPPLSNGAISRMYEMEPSTTQAQSWYG